MLECLGIRKLTSVQVTSRFRFSSSSFTVKSTSLLACNFPAGFRFLFHALIPRFWIAVLYCRTRVPRRLASLKLAPCCGKYSFCVLSPQPAAEGAKLPTKPESAFPRHPHHFWQPGRPNSRSLLDNSAVVGQSLRLARLRGFEHFKNVTCWKSRQVFKRSALRQLSGSRVVGR